MSVLDYIHRTLSATYVQMSNFHIRRIKKLSWQFKNLGVLWLTTHRQSFWPPDRMEEWNTKRIEQQTFLKDFLTLVFLLFHFWNMVFWFEVLRPKLLSSLWGKVPFFQPKRELFEVPRSHELEAKDAFSCFGQKGFVKFLDDSLALFFLFFFFSIRMKFQHFWKRRICFWIWHR